MPGVTSSSSRRAGRGGSPPTASSMNNFVVGEVHRTRQTVAVSQDTFGMEFFGNVKPHGNVQAVNSCFKSFNKAAVVGVGTGGDVDCRSLFC